MIPTPVHDVSGIRRALRIPEGAPVAVCASALQPTGGHRALLHAWRRIADIWPGATLLLAGEGELREAVEAAIRRHDLEDEVKVLGADEDFDVLLQASDLHVVAAEGPGLNVAIASARAAAKPTVAPDTWSARTFVKDGHTGALFPPGDAHGLAAAIASLIQDPFTAEKMGRAAQEQLAARAEEAVPAEAEARP